MQTHDYDLPQEKESMRAINIYEDRPHIVRALFHFDIMAL
jgi:hypothetical protein